jgi:hypothetical protein
MIKVKKKKHTKQRDIKSLGGNGINTWRESKRSRLDNRRVGIKDATNDEREKMLGVAQ